MSNSTSYANLRELGRQAVIGTLATASLVGALRAGEPQAAEPPVNHSGGVATQLVDAVNLHNQGRFFSGKIPDGAVTSNDVRGALSYLGESNADCAILGAAVRNQKSGSVESGLVVVERDAKGNYVLMTSKAGHGGPVATNGDPETYQRAFDNQTPEQALVGGKTVAVTAQAYSGGTECAQIKFGAETHMGGVVAPQKQGDLRYIPPAQTAPLQKTGATTTVPRTPRGGINL